MSMIRLKNMYMLFGIVPLLYISSCKEKYPLKDSEDFYLGINTEDGETPNGVDQYLEETFRRPFNMEVIYRWTGALQDPAASNVPPRYELVEPMMELIRKGLFDPYILTAGDSSFMKDIGLRQFVLVGDPYIVPSSTAIVSGLASGGVRITLFNINNRDLSTGSAVFELFGTMHHEFTHIVNQRVPFPDEYEDISREFYTGNQTGITLAQARERGFTTLYAMNNKMEDFAELMKVYLTLGKDGFEAMLATVPEVGRNKLRAKVTLAEEYYSAHFNIDLGELQIITYNILSNLAP